MRFLITVELNDKSPERVERIEAWLRKAISADFNSDALNGLQHFSVGTLREQDEIIICTT